MSEKRTQPNRARVRATSALAVLTLLALLAVASAAHATYNPIVSGTTKLTLDKGFLSLLRQNGVKLTGKEGATLKGGIATFPVSGGKFDPTTSNGFIEHGGALYFKAGSQKVPLASLQLKTTQKHAHFSDKFGGGQLKVASAKSLAVSREGFGNKVKVSTLKLSAKVATRLDKKLRLKDVFKAGQPLGISVTKANPETVALQQSGKVSLTLDPTTAAKLQSLFVAVNPIFPAEHPGPFTLPIFDGTISPDASLGSVNTSGAIEFVQIGGGQVFLREAWAELGSKAFSTELDAEPSPPYSGKAGRVPVASLSLPGASVSAHPSARTIAVTGTTLIMQPNLATAFNETFAKPLGKPSVFAGGDPLGTLSFTAQGE